jgi:hypothetical protein
VWNEKLSKGGSMNATTERKIDNAREVVESLLKSYSQLAFTKEEKEECLEVFIGIQLKVQEYIDVVVDEIKKG